MKKAIFEQFVNSKEGKLLIGENIRLIRITKDWQNEDVDIIECRIKYPEETYKNMEDFRINSREYNEFLKELSAKVRDHYIEYAYEKENEIFTGYAEMKII